MKAHNIILNNEHYPLLEAENNVGNSGLKLSTGDGYIMFGPLSTSHAHIETDRSNFYFNTELRVNTGIVGSYDEDLYLRRASNSSHQIQITTTAVTTPLNFDAAGYVEGGNFKVNAVEVIDTNRVLKNITRADFGNFTVTGTSTTSPSYLRYANIAANTEGSHMSHPYFFNDLANFGARGGTVTIGGLNTTPAMTQPFKANPNFAGWAASNYTGSTMTITLTSLPKSLNYGGYIGIAFGNSGWGPASCKIEVSTDGGSTWTTRLNDSSKKEIYFTTIATGATGVNAIRFTLGQPTSYLRITNIWAYNYNSNGMEDYFLSKGGGTVYGNITSNGTISWSGGSSTNANTAYGWGNHASQGYATLASPALTGTPTAPTASAGTNTTQIATTAFVGTAVSNLVDSAPGTLNTLNELAAALGDDANFSTTVTNSIATKLPKAGGTMTGALVGTTATFFKDATAGTNALNILGVNNGSGAGITFSDNGTPAASASGQNGYFTYYHGDGQSYGSGNVFILSSSEATTTILADGKLMYKEGIYSKPSSGTGAGTRKDANWDTAYGWGNHASQGYITNSSASLDASKITGGTLNYARIPIPVNGDWWNNGYVRVQTDGVMEVGKYLDFHTADSGGGTDYDVRVTASSGAIDIDGNLTVDAITTSGGITSTGTISGSGVVNATSGYRVNNTTIFDSSRRMQNASIDPYIGVTENYVHGNGLTPTELMHFSPGEGSVLQDTKNFNVLAFKPCTMYRKASGTWSNNGTFSNLTDGKVAHKWGSNIIARGYDEYIFYWANDLGYSFMSSFLIMHSTNGNSMQIHIETAPSGTSPTDAPTTGGWVTEVSSGNVGSWPGSTTIKKNIIVGGSYRPLFRIRIVPNFSHASNAISLGHFVAKAGYGSVTRLFDWDGSRNVTFPANITTGPGTQSTNSDANISIREGNDFAGLDFHTTRTAGNIGGLRYYNTSSNSVPKAQLLVEIDGSYNFYNGTNGAEKRVKIHSNGRVTINQSTAPYSDLEVGGNMQSNRLFLVSSGDAALNSVTHAFQVGVASSTNLIMDTNELMARNNGSASPLHLNGEGGDVTFRNNGTGTTNLVMSGTTFMDQNRNLLNIGNYANTDGHMTLQRTANAPLIVDRLGTTGTSGTFNGEIINLKSAGTKRGEIGYKAFAYGDSPYFATYDWGLGFFSYTSARYIQPCDADGAIRDNQVDLGSTSARFDDVYATNGTIQTSDRNEKQDIQALTDAETRVATACKGLIRRYRWISSVEEKGDDARYHFGAIAQDVEAAFTAEGLDARNYGLFIRTTWWEHEGENYPAAEVAPTGAVEKTRLGIRYNQLFAFIISAL